MTEIICDTRALPAPEPFEVVMDELKKLPKDHYITMIHRKLPKLLFPLLLNMHMAHTIENPEDELFYIYLYHQDDANTFSRQKR